MRSRTRERYSFAVSSYSVQFMPLITGSVMIDYEQESCYFWSWKAIGEHEDGRKQTPAPLTRSRARAKTIGLGAQKNIIAV